jgi:hypothetical protein
VNYVRPPANLLERFLRLRTNDAFLKFAQRFGPLGLSGDRADAVPDPQPYTHERFVQLGFKQEESLHAWRVYQSEFNVLLAFAADIRERQSPKREIIEHLDSRGLIGTVRPRTIGDFLAPQPLIVEVWSTWTLNQRLKFVEGFLRERTTMYVKACRLKPALGLSTGRRESGPRITLVFQDATSENYMMFGLSLFGALTVQLLASATGSGYAVCSACGSVFVPLRRQPAFGKRRYCRACGRTAALKDAKADFRARQRATKAARRRAK